VYGRDGSLRPHRGETPLKRGAGSIPARAFEVLRQEGRGSLFFKILGELGYRRLLIIEREPGKPPIENQSRIEVSCRLLTPNDIDAYLELRPDADRSAIMHRFEAGHRCFGVWHDDCALGSRLINARWAGSGRCWIEYLDVTVEVGADAVYLYETFTTPDFRGSRVTSAGLSFMDAWLQDNGVRLALGAIWPENRSVRRSATRAGFRQVGQIGFWGVGKRRRTFCRYEGKETPIRLV